MAENSIPADNAHVLPFPSRVKFVGALLCSEDESVCLGTFHDRTGRPSVRDALIQRLNADGEMQALKFQLEAEKRNAEAARKACDAARHAAAECRLEFTTLRQRSVIAERTVADLQREVRSLEARLQARAATR